MSDPSPLVSVCMGTHNRLHYVREALASVFGQTRGDFEVVVVDDASTDGVAEFVEGCGDPRVRLVRRSRNSTLPAVPRNEAVACAKGRYVAFLDSDDVWLPLKLERQVQYMEAHPDVDLSHTYCRVMDGESRDLGTRHEGVFDSVTSYFHLLLDHCYITTSTVVMRRDLPGRIGGGFREEPCFRKGEDYEFFLRVARGARIGLVDEVLARYRKSPAGISAGDWRYAPEAVPVLSWVLRHPEVWTGAASRDEVRAALVRANLANCRHWREQRRCARAVHFAVNAFQHEPWSRGVWRSLAASFLGLLTTR